MGHHGPALQLPPSSPALSRVPSCWGHFLGLRVGCAEEGPRAGHSPQGGPCFPNQWQHRKGLTSSPKWTKAYLAGSCHSPGLKPQRPRARGPCGVAGGQRVTRRPLARCRKPERQVLTGVSPGPGVRAALCIWLVLPEVGLRPPGPSCLPDAGTRGGFSWGQGARAGSAGGRQPHTPGPGLSVPLVRPAAWLPAPCHCPQTCSPGTMATLSSQGDVFLEGFRENRSAEGHVAQSPSSPTRENWLWLRGEEIPNRARRFPGPSLGPRWGCGRWPPSGARVGLTVTEVAGSAGPAPAQDDGSNCFVPVPGRPRPPRWLLPSTGTGTSIVAMMTSGLLCQELKVGENFKEMSTSFVGFQLLPQVPVPAAPSKTARVPWPPAASR